jgi:hypothetical protein
LWDLRRSGKRRGNLIDCEAILHSTSGLQSFTGQWDTPSVSRTNAFFSVLTPYTASELMSMSSLGIHLFNRKTTRALTSHVVSFTFDNVTFRTFLYFCLELKVLLLFPHCFCFSIKLSITYTFLTVLQEFIVTFWSHFLASKTI